MTIIKKSTYNKSWSELYFNKKINFKKYQQNEKKNPTDTVKQKNY